MIKVNGKQYCLLYKPEGGKTDLTQYTLQTILQKQVVV